MTHRLLLGALIAFATTVAACGSGDAKTSPPQAAQATSGESAAGTATADDEAAVRRLLVQINEAWARGDAKAYASFHTPNADLIDFRGVHARGRQGIIDLLQPAFDGPLKNTRVEARIVDLRFLSATVAIFHSRGKIVPTGADSIQTFVVTKDRKSGQWLIAAFQNTRVQPA